MDHQPESFHEFLFPPFEYYQFLARSFDQVFKYYNPEMNHELVYQFKHEILRQYPFDDIEFLKLAVEYLHKNNVSINEHKEINVLKRFELVAIKGNWRDFEKLMIEANFKMEHYIKPETLMSILIRNPEVICKMIFPLVNENKADLFKLLFSSHFEYNRADDSQTETLLQLHIEQYSNDPGVHNGIIIYPGIRFNDPELRIVDFLITERSNLKQPSSSLAFIIINTIVLTQRDPEILENTILELIKTGLADDLILNEQLVCCQVIWKKVNFECFSRLIGNEKIKIYFPPSFNDCNWGLDGMIKIMRYPEYFNLYYPLRIKPAGFKTKYKNELFHHLLSFEEVELFLKFYEDEDDFFFIPELPIPQEQYIEEYSRNYKLVIELCSLDVQRAMIHLNTFFLFKLLENEDARMECGRILADWYLDESKRNVTKIFFLRLNSANAPIITVNIKIIRSDLLGFFINAPSSIIFNLDRAEIVKGFEKMNRQSLAKTLKQIKIIPRLYEKLFSVQGLPKETVKRLLEYKNLI